MNHKLRIAAALLTSLGAASGCSSSSSSSTDAGSDARTKDVNVTPPRDAQSPSNDARAKDTGVSDVSVNDAHTFDAHTEDAHTVDAHVADASAHDGGESADAHADGAYPSCGMTWLAEPTLPSVDGGATLAIPVEAGTLKVLLHGQVKSVDAGGGGTQNYKCTEAAGDAGTYSWVLTGPDAKLDDCNGTFLIMHTASDAGSTRPQWASQLDTSVVVGEKIHSVTVAATAVPWLLLQAASTSGTGLLTQVKYVQRMNTTLGVPTSSTCTSATVGSTVDVPYTADYYFYGE